MAHATPTIADPGRPTAQDYAAIAKAMLTAAQRRKIEDDERRRVAWRQFLRTPSRKR